MASGGRGLPGAPPARGTLLLAAALAWIPACGPGGPASGTFVLEGATMGTSYRVTVPGAGTADEPRIGAAVRGELERVDSLMSTYRADSELSRFNRHGSTDPFPLSAETIEVLALARSVGDLTGGAFDVTVGPLVDAWGFGSQAAAAKPSEEELDLLRSATGWTRVALDESGRTAAKADPRIRCDLSGIAKGYAVDRIADSIAGLGFADHLVEIGGEVRAAGTGPGGGPWRLGIERPDETGQLVHRIMRISRGGVATSGDYRNFRVVDGERFSHVLDPRTGRPAAGKVASATVLGPSAARADAFATAMLVLGESEGLALAEREGLAVLLIVREGAAGLREASSSLFRARMRR